MYFLKCRPENIEEMLLKANALFARGSVVVEKIKMSESSWTEMFGDGRIKDNDNISGVPVEFGEDTGNSALIVLGTKVVQDPVTKQSKKSSKRSYKK